MKYLLFFRLAFVFLTVAILMPLLTQATPTSSSKMPASGIFYLCGDEQDDASDHFANSGCAGLSFRASWANVESSEGFYDWNAIDKVMDAARSAHKAVGLGVAAGIRSPGWLNSSGAQISPRNSTPPCL
jgi:hypothetical protein